MKTKLENAKDQITKIVKDLSCPICKNDLNLIDNALECLNKHTFNINKKGIVNFHNAINDKLYNREMFNARKIVLNSGIYDQIFEEISNLISNDASKLIVDLGAGEGTYLSKIDGNNRLIAIDLARDGLNLASDYGNISCFLADLARVPLKNDSVDYILNILSPANYDEFKRILKTDGYLIKIIVNAGYLSELRSSLNIKPHNNQAVIDLLEKNFTIIREKDVKYTKIIPKNLVEHLNKMTPLTSNEEKIEQIENITIDLKIVLAKKK